MVGQRTQSRFPSSVRILMAKPRGSRAVSAEPDSPPTVEKRIVVRALVPTCASVRASAAEDASTHLLEERGTRQIRDVVGDLEVSVGACAFGVHDALGNSLSIKVREEIDVVEVCEQSIDEPAQEGSDGARTLEEERTVRAELACGVRF